MSEAPSIVTVCLNPAVDRTLSVERLTAGAHQKAREVFRNGGGKGVNVSRTLAAFGVSSVATGFLGERNRGEFDEVLADPLIEDRFVSISGRTRENVTVTDRSAGADTHFRCKGAAVDGEAAGRMTDVLGMLAVEGRWMVFAGSLPPGVSAEQFGRWLEQCASAGARVVVDTSGEALAAAAARRVDLLKPNTKELADLAGRDLPDWAGIRSAAEELAERAGTVLLSMGADGAYLTDGREGFRAAAPRPEAPVQNTVGCGDVLLGAFLAHLLLGEPRDAALHRAVRAATAAARHPAPATFDMRLYKRLCEIEA